MTKPQTQTQPTPPTETPRLTLQDVESKIVAEHYFTALDGVYGACHAPHETRPVGEPLNDAQIQVLGRMTVCVLMLANGYLFAGETCCANPAMYDAELGRRNARGRALHKLWRFLSAQPA